MVDTPTCVHVCMCVSVCTYMHVEGCESYEYTEIFLNIPSLSTFYRSRLLPALIERSAI